MSRYIVRVVTGAGREGFLCRGRVVREEHATRYAHPSAALEAARRFNLASPADAISWVVLDNRRPRVPGPVSSRWHIPPGKVREFATRGGRASQAGRSAEERSALGRAGGKARAAALTPERLSAIGRHGGLVSNMQRTPEERSAAARKASLARWAKL